MNVTWRGKTYVGTLLDCTKHDWAPPRFCESPTSDIEAKLGTNTRGKRARTSFNSESVVDTRSTSKLRNGKGRRTANSGYVPPSPAKSDSSLSAKLAGKRKPKPNETDSLSGDDVKRNRPKLDSESGVNSNVDRCSSPTLIECPEPNCSKKYKHMNGLKYHQSHAHAGSSFNINDSQDSEREKGKGDLSDVDYDDMADSPTLKEGSNDANDADDMGGDKGGENFISKESEVVADGLESNNTGNSQGGDENIEKPPNSPSKFSDISEENDTNGNIPEMPFANNNNISNQQSDLPLEKLTSQQLASNSTAPSHISPYSSFFNQSYNFNQTKAATDKGRLSKGEENNSEAASSGNNTNNNMSSHYPNYPGFFQPFGSMGKTLPSTSTSSQDTRHGKPNELDSSFVNNLPKPENKFGDSLKQSSRDNELGSNKPTAASSLLELQNLKNRVSNIGFDQMDTTKRMAMFEAERLKLKEQIKQSQQQQQSQSLDTNKIQSRPKEEKNKTRPDEGVKPTMETTGPPPPTNGYYYNPQFLPSPFSPFDFRSSAMNHMLNSSFGPPPGFPTHPSQMRFPIDGLSMPGNPGPGSRLPPTSQSSNGSSSSLGSSSAPPKPGGSMHHHKLNHNPNTGSKHDRQSLGGGNSSMPVSSHSMMPPSYHHKSSPNKNEHSSSATASSSAPSYVNSTLMSGGPNPSSSPMHPPTQPRHPHYSIYDPYCKYILFFSYLIAMN